MRYSLVCQKWNVFTVKISGGYTHYIQKKCDKENLLQYIGGKNQWQTLGI